MTTDINMQELKKDAVEVFHNGFTCSESVIYTIRKHFQLDLPDDVIAMSSGFPWGTRGRRMYLWCSRRRYNVHRLFLRTSCTGRTG